MTDVQAAIGRAHLGQFPKWQDRRNELAARYDERLGMIEGIILPHRPTIGRHAWHLYVVRVQPSFGLDRDRFIAELADSGIDCSVHFIPLHQQPYLRELNAAGRFPVADEVFEQIVSLPFYQALTDDEVDHVCEVIASMKTHPVGVAL
jgi:dTDP-4-amino-4,6-dideoxygalactose transaminase